MVGTQFGAKNARQQIRIFLNKMHERGKTPEVEKRPDTENKTRPIFSTLKLPYIGDMSHQIEKEIRQFLFKKLSQNQNLLWYMKQQLLAKNSGTRTVKHCYTAQE